MAAVTFEVGDDGKIAGEIPEPVKRVLDAQIKAKEKELSDRAFNEGFAKGNARKADELKPFIVDPAERERVKSLEVELEQRRISDLERDKKYEEAARIRDERYQKELKDKDAQIQARHGKLRRGIDAEIRAAALKYGARDESLTELAVLMGGDIDLDDTLEPYVKGKDGQPAVDATGQRVSIEGRVKQYLDSNRHHLRASGGVGGGAPGGASLDNLPDDVRAATIKLQDAQKRLAANPRDDQAINDILDATRAVSRATHKG